MTLEISYKQYNKGFNMSTLITANLILWLSIFTWFMPAAIDKEFDNQDVTIINHKLDNGEI